MNNIKKIFGNTSIFFVGFVVGSVIDFIFKTIIEKIDKTQPKNVLKLKLYSIFFIQVAVFYSIGEMKDVSQYKNLKGFRRGVWSAFIFSIMFYQKHLRKKESRSLNREGPLEFTSNLLLETSGGVKN